MRRNLLQAPEAVVMIRPHAFHSNPETAADNAFQRKGDEAAATVAAQALAEFDGAVKILRDQGVAVHAEGLRSP